MTQNCVYKITNLINNKSYIGSTNNFLRRMREHKVFVNCSSDRSGYNRPLYRAFRKYGLNNFSFAIIIDNIDTLSHARQLEEQEIKKQNTLTPYGYNLKATTEGPDEELILKLAKEQGIACAKVTPDEEIIEIYYSLREAAKKNNTDGVSVKKVCEGLAYSNNGLLYRYLDKDNNIIEISPKYSLRYTPICSINPFDNNDIHYYPSIKAASQELQVTPTLISKCINGDTRYSVVKGLIWRHFINNKIVENQLSIQEISNQQQQKYILYNNERKSLHVWCQELDKPYDKIRYQMKYKGKTFEEAIRMF